MDSADRARAGRFAAGRDVASGTTPQVMRMLNQRTIYDSLQRLGSASRAELARRTGMSKPTISLAVADLERAGMVKIGRAHV